MRIGAVRFPQSLILDWQTSGTTASGTVVLVDYLSVNSTGEAVIEVVMSGSPPFRWPSAVEEIVGQFPTDEMGSTKT